MLKTSPANRGRRRDRSMYNNCMFIFSTDFARKPAQIANNPRRSVAYITGVMFSRFSGERRQARSERGALDSRDGERAQKIRACKKGILRWCVIWRFLKSVLFYSNLF